eukprot:353864-Chlamydomonas_euryale.AAC.5
MSLAESAVAKADTGMAAHVHACTTRPPWASWYAMRRLPSILSHGRLAIACSSNFSNLTLIDVQPSFLPPDCPADKLPQRLSVYMKAL